MSSRKGSCKPYGVWVGVLVFVCMCVYMYVRVCERSSVGAYMCLNSFNIFIRLNDYKPDFIQCRAP